jgi:hypothetical protein
MHVPRSDRVQARRRLVQKHDHRIAQQGASQTHPLPEALREAPAQVTRSRRHIDGLEDTGNPRAGRRQAVETGKQLQVLVDGESKVQAGVLRHDGDELPDLGAGGRREGYSRNHRRPGGWSDEGPQRPHRCRLPGPIGTQEPEHLAAGDLEGDVLERDALAKTLREVAHHKSRDCPVRQLLLLRHGRCGVPCHAYSDDIAELTARSLTSHI